MLSTLAKWTGQIIGETVHQADRALETAWDGTKSLAEDISDIPSAFAKGYEEELFESDKAVQKDTTDTSSNTELCITKPYYEAKAQANS